MFTGRLCQNNLINTLINNVMNNKKFLLVLIIFPISLLFSQIKLPSVFKDNMVLQQQSEVTIWGKSSPNKKITLKTGWSTESFSSKAGKDSLWHIKFPTPKASYQPYKMVLSEARDSIVINNILFGEVWLCGGQSNMEMPVKGFGHQPVYGSLEDIVNSTNNNIRCFTVQRRISLTQIWDGPGSWEIASPNTTGNFTAVGYYFARQLQQVLNVPVGIIHCSYGASTIEAWMSTEALSEFSNIKIPATLPDAKVQMRVPVVLYNGMLSSVIGYGMRGVIWYQGESNRTAYDVYPQLFESMHKDWIKKWKIGEFPIYFAQIAPFGYNDKNNNSVFMREAQAKIAKTQLNTEMAVLLDVGDSLCIHPPKKKQAGERLAYIAMAKKYGYDKIYYKSPEFQSFEINENKILLKFDSPQIALISFNKIITGFEIAGIDKKFYPANATIVGKQFIEVSAEQVLNPVAVRYAFKDYVQGTLFGSNGLPLTSFRTDDWDEIK